MEEDPGIPAEVLVTDGDVEAVDAVLTEEGLRPALEAFAATLSAPLGGAAGTPADATPDDASASG
ncbi:hypothetical protein [Frankia tisae]|uniref:hypothetical protein n=1 Tax=Frankia tisae TaxID=2950104 RepID=UPI0021C19A88|nr:hypothetical protein [Frankia tisae]